MVALFDYQKWVSVHLAHPTQQYHSPFACHWYIFFAFLECDELCCSCLLLHRNHNTTY